MIKKVLIVAMIVAIIITAMIMLCTTAKSEAYIPSETNESSSITITTPNYTEPKTLNELNIILDDCERRMGNAHVMAEGARALGYLNTDNIITEAKLHYNKAKEDYDSYYNTYYAKLKTDSFWEPKLQQYPVATFIWLYYKNLGYNDYVLAGIFGNIMAEVGGQTLQINHMSRSSDGFYGMCQWSKSYRDVWNKELEDQCIFLQRTIRYEFDTYGYAYKSGFNYEKFCELTNEKEAALAFAKCYERCASASYKQRQKNATVALNYFTK